MFSKADVLISTFHSHRLKKFFHSTNAKLERWDGSGSRERAVADPQAAALLPHGWDLTPTSGSQTEASGNGGREEEKRTGLFPALPLSFP